MSARVVQAARGLYLVCGTKTNWCLIREGDSVTLVDAAWPADYPAVVHSLSHIGATPEQVAAVVLTHAHPDHIGTAERFRVEHAAVVLAHRQEEGHATGRYRQRVRTADLVARLWRPSVMVYAFDVLRHGALRPTPVGAVETFEESPLDVPGRLLPVPTPGHTTGHCSFVLPQHGAVITGDALVNENMLTGHTGPRLLPRIFQHDLEQATASLDRLARLNANLILPGHGALMHMGIDLAVEGARHRLATAGRWDR